MEPHKNEALFHREPRVTCDMDVRGGGGQLLAARQAQVVDALHDNEHLQEDGL